MPASKQLALDLTPRKPAVFTIYCHTCRVNGKRYVGQTKKTMERRWYEHMWHASHGAQNFFARAIRAHGAEPFDHEVLETCASRESANDAEIAWIAHYRSNHPEHGYNLNAGGEANNTHPATRAKLSATWKAKLAAMTPEERSERARKGRMAIPPEQRSEIIRKGHARQTPEQRSARARKAHAALTPEQRSEKSRRGNAKCKDARAAGKRAWWAALPDAQRAEMCAKLKTANAVPREVRQRRARKAFEAMTPEARSARCKLGWEHRKTRKLPCTLTPEQRHQRALKAAATVRERKAAALHSEKEAA